MSNELSVHQFSNITMSPLLDAETGPAVFPYRGKIDPHVFGHFRFGPKRVRNMVELTESTDDIRPAATYRKALFGGYLFSAYGHFLAESIHRLWPLFDDDQFCDLPVIFQSFPRYKERLDKLLPFMEDILAYLKIDASRIVLVNEPVFVQELLVPTQVKWLKDPEVNRAYVKRFEAFSRNIKTTSEKKVYVSRNGYMYSGSYLGESLVEKMLEDMDIKVIRPEEWKIKELMGLYKSAAKIAMVEGSALHAAEISGGIDARLLMISRRELPNLDKQFGYAFAQFSGGCDILERETVLPPLQTATAARSPVIFDLPTLLTKLADFYEISLDQPSKLEIQNAMLFDLARVLLDSRSANLESSEVIGMQFVKVREAVQTLRIFDEIIK
mgnify:CR=1 FL=1